MSDDERLASILAEWQDRRDRGESISADDLVRAHPDLAYEIRASIDALTEVDRALADAGKPLRPLPGNRYADFKPVGMGGMGIVYWAIDTDLNREVAFKVIRPGAGPDEEAEPVDPSDLSPPPRDTPASQTFETLKQRFLQEAWVTGGMAHPGIVPVYELGQTPEGVPYYTMRFIKGERTLADAMAETEGRSIEERLALLEPFLKVCDTIRYAHAQGVIHRDLKPDNVALGEYGEVVVIDWGMAKVQDRPDVTASSWQERVKEYRDARDLKTVAGALGTPGYMSPETALGQVDEVDPRSDVYSLGIVLFQILVGRLPFTFDTYGELLKQLREAAPPEAAASDATVPEPLSRICAKALATRPEDRFPSVGELAEAIRTWQRESAARKEVRALMREADRALQGAEGLKGDALLKQLDRVTVLSSRVLELRPGHGRTQMLLETVKKTRARAIAERERAVRHRERAARRELLRRVAVGAVIVVAAGVAVAAWLYASGRREVWTAEGRAEADRKRAEAAEERADRTGAAATKATRRAAEAEADAEAGRTAQQRAEEQAVAAEVARAAAAREVAVAREAREEVERQLGKERRAKEAALGAAETERAAKEAALARAAEEKRGREEARIEIERAKERRRRSRALALGYAAQLESKRDPALAALLAREALRLDPDAPGAASLRESFQSPGDLRSIILTDDANSVSNASFAFSPDGARIAIGCQDHTVRVFDRDGEELTVLRGHDAPARVGFDPDGERLVTASDDGTARIWDPKGKELAVLRGHTGIVQYAHFAPDGKTVLTASRDGTARIFKTNGKTKTVLEVPGQQIWAAWYSPRGDRIIVTTKGSLKDEEGTARLFDARGKLIRVLEGHRGWVSTASFSPDGERVLTTSYDHTARIWDLETGASVPLIGHTERLHGGIFSPDGTLVATGAWDGTARLWNLEGKMLRVLKVYRGRGATPYPSFGPQGTWLSTAGREEYPIRIWDLEGRELAQLGGMEGGGAGGIPMPDGASIFTLDHVGTARLFFVNGAELARLGKIPLTRELTEEERIRYADLLEE